MAERLVKGFVIIEIRTGVGYIVLDLCGQIAYLVNCGVDPTPNLHYLYTRTCRYLGKGFCKQLSDSSPCLPAQASREAVVQVKLWNSQKTFYKISYPSNGPS